MMIRISAISHASAIAVAISLLASSANAAAMSVPGMIPHAKSVDTASTGYMKGYFDDETHYNVERPERGYQGGTETVYCSYRNEPKHVCTTTRDGRRKCRVTGWTLIESCN